MILFNPVLQCVEDFVKYKVHTLPSIGMEANKHLKAFLFASILMNGSV